MLVVEYMGFNLYYFQKIFDGIQVGDPRSLASISLYMCYWPSVVQSCLDFSSFCLLKIMEISIGKQGSPERKVASHDVTFSRCREYESGRCSDRGCLMQSVSYMDMSNSLQLAGQSSQVPMHLIRLDLCSYHWKLLLLCGCAALTLCSCLERQAY